MDKWTFVCRPKDKGALGIKKSRKDEYKFAL
jgi:hypothetical protein